MVVVANDTDADDDILFVDSVGIASSDHPTQ